MTTSILNTLKIFTSKFPTFTPQALFSIILIITMVVITYLSVIYPVCNIQPWSCSISSTNFLNDQDIVVYVRPSTQCVSELPPAPTPITLSSSMVICAVTFNLAFLYFIITKG